MIKGVMLILSLTSCNNVLSVAESENTCKLMSVRNGYEGSFISSTEVMKKGHAMCYGLSAGKPPEEIGKVVGETTVSDIKEGYQSAMCADTNDCEEFIEFTNSLFKAIDDLIHFRKVE